MSIIKLPLEGESHPVVFLSDGYALKVTLHSANVI